MTYSNLLKMKYACLLQFPGADAILMHSKKSDPSDIEAFMKAWNNQASVTPFSDQNFRSRHATIVTLGS